MKPATKILIAYLVCVLSTAGAVWFDHGLKGVLIVMAGGAFVYAMMQAILDPDIDKH